MFEEQKGEATFIEHLEELRWVIIKMLIAFAVFFPVCFYFSDDILEKMLSNLITDEIVLRFFSPVEPFIVQIKLSAYVAFFVSSPYLIFKVWGFLVPAFEGKEKTIAKRFVIFSWLLFVVGTAFASLIVLPIVMSFSMSFQTGYLQPAIGIAQFVNLVLMLSLSFGIVFQLPIIVYVLVKIGVVSCSDLKKLRPVILAVILLLSAFLTPPDVFSQILLGVPAWLLFEVGLAAAAAADKKTDD